MEDKVFDLEHLVGFDWDEGNKQKNWEKHQVDYTELKTLANKRDVPYQSLVKMFLAEKVREESTNSISSDAS